MTDYLYRYIGVRNTALAYVIQTNPIVLVITALQLRSPHSEEHGSVKAELIAPASRAHPLDREDNQIVYYKIEEGASHLVGLIN